MSQSDRIDDSLRETIKKDLALKIVSALENGQFKPSQMRESANFVLESVNNVNTQAELESFLGKLRAKWPVFADTHTIHRARSVQEKEKEIINKLENYIKKFQH